MSSELASSLQLAIDSLPDSPHDDHDAGRLRILSLAQKLVQKLETPEDRIRRLGYETHSHQLCLRLAVDLRIFHILAQNITPTNSKDLANACGAQELLVIRVMRVLTAIGFAAETGAQRYTANPTTHAMTDMAQEAMVRSASDDTVQIFAQLPRAFQQRGYHCPTEALDCPLQWTMGTQLKYFDWVAQSPQQARDLVMSMKAMQATSIGQQWFDFYPVEKRLLDGWRTEDAGGHRILLVDLGGGNGHDLKCLIERYPQVKAHSDKLILQDLPEVVAAIDGRDLPGVQRIAGNFFDPLPVQGARAYYSHRVLHNWADSQARILLQNVRDAMSPGYSVLLLNETILPDTGCSSFHAAGDLSMMAILGGIKRTTTQWRDLLSSVGLSLVRVWTNSDPRDLDGVLEVAKAN